MNIAADLCFEILQREEGDETQVSTDFYLVTIVEAQDSQQFKLQYVDFGTVALQSQDQLYTLVLGLRPRNFPRMSEKVKLHEV